MPPIRIELLGNLRLYAGGQPLSSVNTNRLQSLLAFLVLHPDPQSREHLAYLLWPESGESQARTNLRQLLHHLRRALPVECSLLVSDNHTVQWRRDPCCTVDVEEFDAAVQRADWAEAARLYEDDLLPGLYDQWIQPLREQLRHRFVEVLERLTAQLESAGDFAEGIRQAARLVAQDPLRETSYQVLMRLHIRNHDRSSALRVYHQCMRTLQRELGVSPGKATQDLFTQAMQSDGYAPAPAELPSYAASTPSPLIGRKDEWDRLVACWRSAGTGEAHFALISGEPGVGKSRLAEELFRLGAKDTAARGRCYFAQGQLAYAPVAEWLRSEPMRRARMQLPKSQLAELARVLPEILAENPDIAPPQPLTESWQRRHFYEALNAAFAKSPRPLLLLIDDLQWCDHDSFEWLHSFVHSGAAAQTLVLGTVRPEETGRDHPLTGLTRELRQSGQFTELPLASLSLEDTAALARQVAGKECDAAFLDGLYRSTKGNPLFIVESVRAAEDPPSKAAPPRVQAVISGRLAQLSPAAYELGEFAAAIGRPFSIELLAKSTDWDEESLSRALEELWQRRIIEGRSAEAYDYTHDLLREVAYAEVSPVRRKFLHRRVARALEELHGNEIESVSGRLAAHYDAAGMAKEAIRSYRAAAAVARQRFADAEAADWIRRALRLCRDFPQNAARDEEELELLVTLGPALVTTQGYGMPEVGAAYGRALALSQSSGERKHFFSVTSGAWLFHIVRADLEESRRLGEQALHWEGSEGIPELKMGAHFLLGSCLFHMGQLAASHEHIEKALPPYSSPVHPALALFAGPDLRVFCRSYLAHLLCQFDETEQGAAAAREAIVLAREVSSPFGLAIALDYAAMMNVFRNEHEQALDQAEEASSVCRKHGFAYYLAWAEIVAGWAAAIKGDPASGLARFRMGLDALRDTGAELRLPFYYGLLAEIYALTDQLTEAQASVASGFAFQTKNRETWQAPELHRILGDLLARTGKKTEARSSYSRAVDSARQTGARLFERRASERLRSVS